MTTEAQQIAIAEACGWKPNPFEIDMRGQVFPQSPPDYLRDLNAMHEAEKRLSASQLSAYVGELANAIINGENKTTLGNQMWHATAAQRSEAFLKTIGKWEE